VPAAAAAGKPAPAAGPALSGQCAVLVSPKVPRPGGRLRVLVAFEADAARVQAFLRGPAGALEPLKTKRGGGPPFWVAAEFSAGPEGSYALTLNEGRDERQALTVEVSAGGAPKARPAEGALGAKGWSRAEESLYAAWIEALFAEADERSSWKALHEVMRDPERNVLHDHLGLGEDDAAGPNALVMTPDCADNPYFLRAYFAWKLGLPFGFHETSWGSREQAPRGLRFRTDGLSAGTEAGNPVRRFGRFLALIKNTVHAGNGRTALRADATDYYPLPLTRKALKPGTVYADPYGHTLTIVRWVPQTAKRPGLLLAVDAQPDGTIGVKRFWKGNFLFTTEDVVGEPGFKAFRPIALENGRPRLPTNREIAANPDFGDFSLEQEKMTGDAFYAAMEKLINPEPLDAAAAFEDLFRALHEQLIVRVDSVANGEEFMRANPGTVIPMPSGPAVYQTLGRWEDFSTPNRDLRLLIAVDTILGFPDKVAANPAAYEVSGKKTPDEVRRGLLALQKKLAAGLSITYRRSDGTPRALTLEDIFARRDAFEMGYNPNDSVEVRWGAPEGSEELSTTRRRAPASQLEKMKALRPWFHKRLRPS
jgi:hypothetical protein